MIGIIVSLVIAGLVVGGLGRLVVPGRQHIGVWRTIGIGILGAFVGGMIARLVGLGAFLALIPEVAVAGLLVYAITGRRGARRRRFGF
jgi:uncharacterized membrane protein YeaQ/YmgE (transglycosylase-associated protein family)